MFSRRQPLFKRLMMAFNLFAGVTLLAAWLIALAYFFVSERDDQLEMIHTATAIVANQSSAALMFGDEQVLNENLASLAYLKGLQWAAIVPTNVTLPTPVVRFGNVSGFPEDVLASLAGVSERVELTRVTVRKTIVHQGVARGELLLVIDLMHEIVEFGKVCVFSVLLLGCVFLLAQRLYRYIAQGIVDPVSALTLVAVNVSQRAEAGNSLQALNRPLMTGQDEVGKLAEAVNRMLNALIQRDHKMATQAMQLEHSVESLRALSARMRALREEERTRISHEIHDELGQRLTALKFDIAALADAGVRGRIATQIDELIRAVRVISWDLRPSVLDSLGLVAAIEWQAQDFARRIGVRCDVNLPDEDVDLAPDLATDIFRICQELLTNVTRHARASRVDIVFELTDDTIHFEVKDNGCGMPRRDRARLSLGLMGIRERLERWGGTFKISPASADKTPAGTCVHVTIPRSSTLTDQVRGTPLNPFITANAGTNSGVS